jgi:homoserine dehydrogenase
LPRISESTTAESARQGKTGETTVQPVRIGICGLGTVGKGVLSVLKRNGSEIARRAGRQIETRMAASRTSKPELDLQDIVHTHDVFQIADDPAVDVLVELIGGLEPARELVLRAIERGKHVVTANKALIAVHGNEIFRAAQEHGVIVAFEAAVAGGIPIIKAIREGLSANRINWVVGIVNGTSNYILTEMAENDGGYGPALKEAQRLGYAEADPTFDVGGVDAAHKITILASIAFGIPLNFQGAYTEGITEITPDDIDYAGELGYRVKPLAITRATDAGVELRVHPALVPKDRLLASVEGVMNAILVNSDAVGSTLYYGPGAGGEPTASSVIGDLVDVVRAMTTDPTNRVPHLAFQPDRLSDTPVLGIEDVVAPCYLRMLAADEPGVLARVAQFLSHERISIESVIQKYQEVRDQHGKRWVPIVILTHAARERDLNAALKSIEALDSIRGKVNRVRVESLDAAP